jgi:hypothetical protein
MADVAASPAGFSGSFTASSSVADIAAIPPPTSLGSRTCLQKGICQPKRYTDGTMRYGMLSSTGEPRSLPAALNDPHWRSDMQDEYDALMMNKTWTLVPPSTNKNITDFK